MEMAIVGFAVYGLVCLILILFKPKKPVWLSACIAALAVLLYCWFACGFTVTKTIEYFPILLLAATGFAYWLGPKDK